MRLRSRVFVGGTIVMAALVVIGIVAASLLAGKTSPVRVGFSGGSQALERSFAASAAALGASVTVSDIDDADAGKAQITAGTLDVLVMGSSIAPTAVAKDAVPSDVESALSLAAEAARLSDAGLSPAAVKSAMALVPVQLLSPKRPKTTRTCSPAWPWGYSYGSHSASTGIRWPRAWSRRRRRGSWRSCWARSSRAACSRARSSG